MTPRRPHAWLARVAAFVAVALLSLASAQSAVMQVAAVADPGLLWPICAVPAPTKAAPRTPSDHKADAVCGLCAAASATPLCSVSAPLPVPLAVAWTPKSVIAALGPRGPPRFRPRARAPPFRPQAV